MQGAPPAPIDRSTRLAAELSELGLNTEDAKRLSSLATVQFPLARRVGVRTVERWLRSAGVPAEEAADGAAVLFALDALDMGRPFDRVVRDLGVAGMDPARAQGAAFEAARIQRGSPRPSRENEIPASLIVCALASTLALAVVFIHLLMTHGGS
jgi:CheY-like chemotaxis protein